MVCQLDRLCSHTSSDDHRVYRPQDEIDAMAERDPIVVLSRELIDAGELDADDWEKIKEAIKQQVDDDYLAAEEEQDPDPQELLDHLMADPPPAIAPPIKGGKKLRMVDSINAVFQHGLNNNDRYIFFGEDIEDPKGGVFGLTSGLSENHPTRAFNSPLAEATIAGVGIGMACYGMHPVFEFQFVDFVGPGLEPNQSESRHIALAFVR